MALLSLIFYQQALPWQVLLGLVLIVSGVVLVNAYSGAHAT